MKVPLQNNKNWASSKSLVRKREKMCLSQNLGMWNSKNGTSCAVMYLSFTYMLSIQGKNIFISHIYNIVKSQKVIAFTCNMQKKIEKLT